MTLAVAREALFGALVLPAGVFTSREETSLRKHVDELSAAAKFGMWKSVTLLASQMVEAFLAKKLAAHRGTSQVPRQATFGQLIEAAIISGVLPDDSKPVLGVTVNISCPCCKELVVSLHIVVKISYRTPSNTSDCLDAVRT